MVPTEIERNEVKKSMAYDLIEIDPYINLSPSP